VSLKHKSPPPRKNLPMSEIPIVQPESRKASSSSPAVKQVRLNLVYVDVWSAVKLSSLVSLAVSITVFLSVILSWLLLNTVGVIGALEGIVGDILGDGGGAILALLSFGQVTLLAFVGALITWYR